MTRFAYVFLEDFKQHKLAYIWFNTKPETITRHGEHIISVVQATHQQATEKKLLKLVREHYASAKIVEDERSFRYIKI